MPKPLSGLGLGVGAKAREGAVHPSKSVGGTVGVELVVVAAATRCFNPNRFADFSDKRMVCLLPHMYVKRVEEGAVPVPVPVSVAFI